MTKKGLIVEKTIEVLREYSTDAVAWGDTYILDEIAKRTGITTPHPLNRHARVLAALERSDEFEKMYLRVHRLVRMFRLKEPKKHGIFLK